MGKKQHQKDKLYLTCTEWKSFYGGKRAAGPSAGFRRLPFHCCSLSFQPFRNPYCSKDGIVFDLVNIMPFLKQHGLNPVSGEKMTSKDLIKLKFHKNADDKYHCPVTYKVFNENTKIVAVRTSGNVYAMDAIEQLNIKPNQMKDLLDGQAFTKKDIIVIQDPANLSKSDLSQFWHVRKEFRLAESKQDTGATIRAPNQVTKETLHHMATEFVPATGAITSDNVNKHPEKAVDKFNAASHSTGTVAASLTSTVMEPTTTMERAALDDDFVKYRLVKSKGYVRLNTSFGQLNLELHCDIAPLACDNFIQLCRRGYYDDTVIHRVVRNFVLQGGDPTGTGTGGESCWGPDRPFRDEFRPNLQHRGRGVLSMANSGRNSNTSQFFITFRSAPHLNDKHPVFGKVVGGLDTLDRVEAVDVDRDDRPVEPIRLLTAVVFVDPFEEAEARLRTQRAQEADAEEALRRGATAGGGGGAARGANTTPAIPRPRGTGVGRFIDMAQLKKRLDADDNQDYGSAAKKKKSAKSDLSDFSAW